MYWKEIYSTIEKYNDKDFVLGGEYNINSIPKARKTFWDKKIQFNQNKIDREGCVYHAGVGCLADEADFDYISFLKKCNQNKYKYGFIDNVGMYIYRGVDMIRDLRNKQNPNDKIITFRVAVGGKEFFDLLEKGYSIHVGYRGNSKYNKDKNEDGVLDNVYFGEPTYGHSVRITKKDNFLYIVDNYYGIKYNIYKIPDIITLVKNGVFFKYGYVYVFENDYNNKKDKDISIQDDINAVQYALKVGITKNKQELIDIKNGKYTPDNRTTIKIVRAIKILKQLD